MSDDITREEFVRRFTAELVRIVGPTYEVETEEDDPTSTETRDTAEYANGVGWTYYADPDQRAEGPEVCAQEEYSEWE